MPPVGCVLVEAASWAGLVFRDLEQRRCVVCQRPVWWPVLNPDAAPLCVGATWSGQDQDSCFARAFMGTN